MKTTHTPGPWIVEESRGAYRYAIGTTWTPDGQRDLVAMANTEGDARLIAAAPELLAALEDLRASVQKWAPQIDQSRARAAIAKAKGS